MYCFYHRPLSIYERDYALCYLCGWDNLCWTKLWNDKPRDWIVGTKATKWRTLGFRDEWKLSVFLGIKLYRRGQWILSFSTSVHCKNAGDSRHGQLRPRYYSIFLGILRIRSTWDTNEWRVENTIYINQVTMMYIIKHLIWQLSYDKDYPTTLVLTSMYRIYKKSTNQ